MHDLARMLVIGSALPFVFLGSLHGWFTVQSARGPGAFWPRDTALVDGMRASGLVLTRRTTMWLAWLGFHFSHSLGAVLFGVVMLAVARDAETFAREAPVFLPLALVVAVTYLAIGLRYWFRNPNTGIAISLACLVAAAVVRVAGPAAAAPARAAADTVAVRAALDAQVAAWNRGDLEGYMAGYWKSPALVFFSNGSETRGWQETLDRYRKRYQGEGRQMGRLDFPSLEVQALGEDAALARGRWHLRMPDGTEQSGMTTVVFRRFPDGWRIVHDHSSG